jgi:hypothetical protein
MGRHAEPTDGRRSALIPNRILMSWVYVNTNSSLLSGIIMHAFYDAPWGPAPGDPRSGCDRGVLHGAQRGALDRGGRRGGRLRGAESGAGKWSQATRCCAHARSIAGALTGAGARSPAPADAVLSRKSLANPAGCVTPSSSRDRPAGQGRRRNSPPSLFSLSWAEPAPRPASAARSCGSGPARTAR